jgi:hypothetical protein
MAICPICKSDAEEIESGFMDGKTFRCAKHGEFQVSDSVQWEAALKHAAWRARPHGCRYEPSRPRSAPTNPLI